MFLCGRSALWRRAKVSLGEGQPFLFRLVIDFVVGRQKVLSLLGEPPRVIYLVQQQLDPASQREVIER